MTSFWIVDCLCLALVITGALLVVFLRSLTAAVMAVSAVGTVLAALFVVWPPPMSRWPRSWSARSPSRCCT